MSIYTTPVLNINLKKLIDNYKQLMTLSTPAIPAVVVKDDAYGIGAKIVTPGHNGDPGSGLVRPKNGHFRKARFIK